MPTSCCNFYWKKCFLLGWNSRLPTKEPRWESWCIRRRFGKLSHFWYAFLSFITKKLAFLKQNCYQLGLLNNCWSLPGLDFTYNGINDKNKFTKFSLIRCTLKKTSYFIITVTCRKSEEAVFYASLLSVVFVLVFSCVVSYQLWHLQRPLRFYGCLAIFFLENTNVNHRFELFPKKVVS